jgi:hypothetical protein
MGLNKKGEIFLRADMIYEALRDRCGAIVISGGRNKIGRLSSAAQFENVEVVEVLS